jgi:uncharacterized protein YggU (UPF0235/DUF167 family)
VSGFDAQCRENAVRRSRRNVCIVSCHTSRNKVVEASEVGLEAVQHLATRGESS